ncbi:MAG: STAS domain-containing protein [Planctomycetota bacterium]|jgi:anti-anti-sigma factor
MATVEFKIKNLKGPDGTKGTLAEIAGSIDATSIVQFQNVMDKLVEKGVKNLILDCASVKYINSTGLGTLLKYVDTFESVDGHIAFTRVPSKVMLVMEMLGFNALFTIVPDEAAALRLFGGGAAQAAPAAPAAPSISPAQPPAAPSISRPAGPASAASPTIVIPPGQLPGITRGAATPTPAPAGAPAAAPAAPGGYPAAAECLRCGLTLDVGGAGKYKCPRCMSVVVAEPGGKVRFFAPKKSRPVSVTLPAQPGLIEGVGRLAEGVAKQSGFSSPAAGLVGQAVCAASRGVLEAAYAGDTTGLIHLIMVPDGDSLTIRMSDYGNTIPAEGGVPTAASFAPVTQIMDSVALEPNPKRGNLLTLTKSAG